MPYQMTTIPLTMVNAYLIRVEDGFILVDTGVASQWANLDKALQENGCKPGKLRLVILTHGDHDHTGNAAKLQQEYKAPIAIHKNDAPMVETGEIPKRTINSLFMRMFITFAGIAEKLNKKSNGFATFKPDVLLEDGQDLSTNGLDAVVHHLPGHTKGTIAVLTGQDELLAGDLLSNMGGKPGLSPFVDDEKVYLESIEKLKQMKVTIVYPGHGKAFDFSLFR